MLDLCETELTFYGRTAILLSSLFIRYKWGYIMARNGVHEASTDQFAQANALFSQISTAISSRDIATIEQILERAPLVATIIQTKQLYHLYQANPHAEPSFLSSLLQLFSRYGGCQDIEQAFDRKFARQTKQNMLGLVAIDDFQVFAHTYVSLGYAELSPDTMVNLPVQCTRSLQQRFELLIKHSIFSFSFRDRRFHGTVMHLAIANEIPYAAICFINACLETEKYTELWDQLHVKDINGNTVAKLAATFSNDKLLELILQTEAFIAPKLPGGRQRTLANEQDSDGLTPLQVAAVVSSVACVNVLLQYGATDTLESVRSYVDDMHHANGKKLRQFLNAYSLNPDRSESAYFNDLRLMVSHYDEEIGMPVYYDAPALMLTDDKSPTIPYKKSKKMDCLKAIKTLRQLSLNETFDQDSFDVARLYWIDTFKEMSDRSLLASCCDSLRQHEINTLLSNRPAQVIHKNKKKKKKKPAKSALFNEVVEERGTSAVAIPTKSSAH